MKISDRIRAFAVVSVMFFAFSLFAEAEQAEEKPAEEVKSEESVETDSEPKSEEAKSEETAEVKPEEAKPEETAEAQNGSNENIEVEVVDETENFVFSARSLDKMTWEEAQNYCKNLDFHGDTWHLPDIDELRQIVRNCPATEAGGSCRVSEEGNCLSGNCSAPKESCTCERKAKNRGHYSMFGDADYIGLWSSSTLSNDAGKAWGAVFYSGMIGSVGKNSKLYARCVYSFKSVIEEKDIVVGDKGGKTGGTAIVTFEGLSDKVVYDHFDKKMDEVLKCVYKGARGDMDLSHGRVAIDYTISPTGEVVYAAVQMSTAGNLTVENCIANVVKEIKFPAPKNGKTVEGNHVFKFSLKRKR